MRRLNFTVRTTVLVAGLMVPLRSAAHAVDGVHHWWTLDPWVWVPLSLFCALYVKGIFSIRNQRRTIGRTSGVVQARALFCFGAGAAALFIALIWPLDALGEISFAAHMAQHMVLIAIAAPLLVAARTAVPVAVALSGVWPHTFVWFAQVRKMSRIALRPNLAFSIHAVIIWLWHAPLLFDAALRWQWLHIIEHISFLASGMLFWAALRQAGRSGGDGWGVAALWTLATLIHTGILGALITFAPRLIYSSYGAGNGIALTPMEDQQLAGLIMWIPGGLCYLIVGIGFAAAWLRHAEDGDRLMLPASAPPAAEQRRR
jgi:putative membrane protein